MKDTLSILASRDVKAIRRIIEMQWGCDLKEFFKAHGMLRSTKEKLFAVSRDIQKLDLGKVRINNIGVYFAEHKKGQMRLSIEGSQIVGPLASKNVADFDKDQLRAWFKGEDISIEGEFSDFVIVRHGSDYCGSGKFKEGTILNFVPKARRLLVVH